MLNIGIIGAGVVGLSSAINAQLNFPHAQVTVLADKIGPETVSYGAGGLFRPNLETISIVGDSGELMRQCLRDSWEQYRGLAMSERGPESGQMMVPGNIYHSKPMEEAYKYLAEVAIDFHRVPESKVQREGLPKELKYVYACTSIVSQANVYLTWLMKQFKNNGGKIVRRKVNNMEELFGEFHLVINCCGLGAEKMLNDKECYPTRGQLARLKAPWMRQFHFVEGDIYIIPHMEKIIVGGIRYKGDYRTDIDPEINQSILDNAERVFPELKGAERMESWAASRPGRTTLRLEAEIMDFGGNRRLPVIHNYGHGGHGITLSWGTAVHACRLSVEALRSIPKASL